jgi:hypothetical protein
VWTLLALLGVILYGILDHVILAPRRLEARYGDAWRAYNTASYPPARLSAPDASGPAV